jgi:hypothetical protein
MSWSTVKVVTTRNGLSGAAFSAEPGWVVGLSSANPKAARHKRATAAPQFRGRLVHFEFTYFLLGAEKYPVVQFVAL